MLHIKHKMLLYQLITYPIGNPNFIHSETADGSKSSDLVPSDHELEVESSPAWELPPQQEQVSALAPETLTPGCIVAIVFGVIFSLGILMGTSRDFCQYHLLYIHATTFRNELGALKIIHEQNHVLVQYLCNVVCFSCYQSNVCDY